VENKERTLKAAREKYQGFYNDRSITITADFSTETIKARRTWDNVFHHWKKITANLNYSTQQSLHS
jgi:type I restriction-modification system DNA methylase subunit